MAADVGGVSPFREREGQPPRRQRASGGRKDSMTATMNRIGDAWRGWFHRLVRRISSWAWQKEIGTCEGLAVLKGLDMEEGHMDIKIQQDPALAQWIAKCFASMVADSPNYTEMKLDLCGQYRGKFEWITVHIQKGNGKTPHQMRQEVERERDELRARLNPPND
jgi:hypothetical protein